MTDRINALTVVLDQDYRDDDLEALISAIGCLRGVLSVDANVSHIQDHIARRLAVQDIRARLYAALDGVDA